MSVKTMIINNEFQFDISGELDLSAAAAVSAIRCSNASAVKGAAGTYTVTVLNPNKIKLVELLGRNVVFAGGAPVTALGCRVASVTQSATDDSFIITLKTTATAGGSGADTDGTAAVTLSFTVKLRTNKLGNPL